MDTTLPDCRVGHVRGVVLFVLIMMLAIENAEVTVIITQLGGMPNLFIPCGRWGSR